ncbi:MerR family transcriptional regulator [Terrabacter sp. MAHUQ-38]|uniref:MerR family transcriptional regulator n=1 Tax=unclassified Terrabacter TaxID=2630222 RepID=UPI00165DA506|nr:MerR family transcriptional regulator [Terrabacter sp. MAHUQ-38]MBC9822806.1 MerR family transcriptional regulator [Terrabacter sp. MAHUQ-38]
MNDDELVPIGRFARLTGLSIHALRHYDEVDLLRPAEVDPDNGYRRYAGGQTQTARLIADLRWLDLPIEEIRVVLADPDGADASAVLRRHRDRLQRSYVQLGRQLGNTTRYLTEGIPMPTTATTIVPSLLKIAVEDIDQARRFYREAFGFEEQVARHTDDQDFRGFTFGTYGQPGFFLIFLTQVDWNELDRPGPSTFGLLVPDLDEAHARALAAGAIEAYSPRDAQGMPRHSAVKDPSGNWVTLFQG